MLANSKQKKYHSTQKKLEWILVILSSFLLGIWAVKNTIALRNILIISGTLISIYYIINEFRYFDLKKKCTFSRIFPIFLIFVVFFWVISHYILFSLDAAKQFDELKSTWLRAFMAAIIGLATGLSLSKNPNRISILWFGILIAFVVLFFQYLPRALAQKKLLVPDYEYYLFHLKINTVMIGSILIAGIDGALLDNFRTRGYSWSKLNLIHQLYWLLGTFLVLWTYVYIIDSRNGIGIGLILYSFWFIYALHFFFCNRLQQSNIKNFSTLLIASIGFCMILYFLSLQTNINKGWDTFFKDAKIAVQIDKYQNWQNTGRMGYPKNEDGKQVVANTYERIAWITAGSRAIIDYPQGAGILSFPWSRHPNPPPNMNLEDENRGIATHSGWVELGLSFGIPILGLIFTSVLITFIEAARSTFPLKMTALGLLISIVTLYMVGEVAVQHGIEILFFMLTLIPALLITIQTLKK